MLWQKHRYMNLALYIYALTFNHMFSREFRSGLYGMPLLVRLSDTPVLKYEGFYL